MLVVGDHNVGQPVGSLTMWVARLDDVGIADLSRMCLWTRQTFDGDLRISLQFKVLANGGLALLITHAAGMRDEDQVADYALLFRNLRIEQDPDFAILPL